MTGFVVPLHTPLALAQSSSVEMLPMPRSRPLALPTHAAVPAPSSEATAAIAAVISTPQPVTLTAHIIPEGVTISNGLIWRIFESKAGSDGALGLVAKSDDGIAHVELAPGDYVVHVAYGRAQISEPIAVMPGLNAKDFVLEAGALRLNSAVIGDIVIPPNMLRFDIYTGDDANRTMVDEGLLPNDIIILNAGTYHIISHFGTVNAVVRADLRVEPDQLTDATLYHHASQISFKLASEEGGEAIADVEWTVKTADGATIYSDLGAFPSTVLAEGNYLVLAKQGEQVFNREFKVSPGSAREIEVLTTVY
ncbi:MAG: hypothetical protein MO846_09330 [Candidatus Devosia symbiotica]|nr:hypothetical protein [Candidatus Devosia symbiotica]